MMMMMAQRFTPRSPHCSSDGQAQHHSYPLLPLSSSLFFVIINIIWIVIVLVEYVTTTEKEDLEKAMWDKVWQPYLVWSFRTSRPLLGSNMLKEKIQQDSSFLSVSVNYHQVVGPGEKLIALLVEIVKFFRWYCAPLLPAPLLDLHLCHPLFHNDHPQFHHPHNHYWHYSLCHSLSL